MLDRILSLPLSKELIVVLIGVLPIFELRGALPIGINLFRLTWYYAFFLSVVGNMLPVPLLLLLFNGISKLFYRVSFFKRPLDWISDHTKRRSQSVVRYGLPGLLVLVAIPLPFTGAWTASLVAVLLGIRFISAFLTIFTGVIIAGVIVTILSLMGWVGASVAGAVLIGVTLLGMFKTARDGKKS